MSIILTDKQEEAKERMEKSLQMSHRNWFSSYNEFNEYMNLLIKKIKKRINLANAVKSGKITYEEVNKKAKEKKEKYYNNPDNLWKYAVKYINKYYPSYNKLIKKLKEKSNNEELSKELADWLLKIGVQKPDNELIKLYLNQYLIMGKNFSKIKTLLIKKEFKIEDVKLIIDTFKENLESSLLDPFTLKRKILTLLKKWKSEYYIMNKFAETEYDRELVNEILEELNFDNTEIMLKEIDKLKSRWYDKQKIINKMFYKGYKYDDFKEYLN